MKWFRKKEKPESEFGDGLRTVIIVVDGVPIRLLRMSEMPATNLFDIMDELDPREQLDKMLVLLRSALMNPNDWDMHLKSMSARGMQQLLGMWSETVFDEGEQRGKKKSR